MINDATLFLNRYSKFYCDYAADWWRNMSPVEYGGLLIAISVIGWVLMRSGPR